MNHFAVFYQYPADSEAIAEARPVHREFLGKLKEEGKLVGSGPFLDDRGGALIIIRLDGTLDDATALMDNDPFWVNKVVDDRDIREWNPVLNVFN